VMECWDELTIPAGGGTASGAYSLATYNLYDTIRCLSRIKMVKLSQSVASAATLRSTIASFNLWTN
jgi:hypothetical protein